MQLRENGTQHPSNESQPQNLSKDATPHESQIQKWDEGGGREEKGSLMMFCVRGFLSSTFHCVGSIGPSVQVFDGESSKMEPNYF